MVALPTVGEGIVTSTAPQSSVSRGDIQQNADLMANAMGKVADASSDIATQMAREQAGTDLQNQKVTLGPDGSAQVVNPANSLIFGRAGEAYHAAVQAGTIAQHSNVISQEMNDMHQKYQTDPAGFKTASDAWKAQYAEQHGDGQVGQAIMQQADQLQTQHFNSITNETASNDVVNQKKSITAVIEDQKNTAIALARQGGTNTPEFQQAVQKMNASYDALGTNPLFKTPPDQIELEKKNTAGLLQGESLVAHVDATFNKRGKAQAAAELQSLLTNPNLREVDRSRLYTQGLSRLAYLTADAKMNIDANRQITTGMEEGLAKGTIKPEDPAIGQAIQRARAIGDTEGAQRITAAAAVKQQFPRCQLAARCTEGRSAWHTRWRGQSGNSPGRARVAKHHIRDRIRGPLQRPLRRQRRQDVSGLQRPSAHCRADHLRTGCRQEFERGGPLPVHCVDMGFAKGKARPERLLAGQSGYRGVGSGADRIQGQDRQGPVDDAEIRPDR